MRCVVWQNFQWYFCFGDLGKHHHPMTANLDGTLHMCWEQNTTTTFSVTFYFLHFSLLLSVWHFAFYINGIGIQYFSKKKAKKVYFKGLKKINFQCLVPNWVKLSLIFMTIVNIATTRVQSDDIFRRSVFVWRKRFAYYRSLSRSFNFLTNRNAGLAPLCLFTLNSCKKANFKVTVNKIRFRNRLYDRHENCLVEIRIKEYAWCIP